MNEMKVCMADFITSPSWASNVATLWVPQCNSGTELKLRTGSSLIKTRRVIGNLCYDLNNVRTQDLNLQQIVKDVCREPITLRLVAIVFLTIEPKPMAQQLIHIYARNLQEVDSNLALVLKLEMQRIISQEFHAIQSSMNNSATLVQWLTSAPNRRRFIKPDAVLIPFQVIYINYIFIHTWNIEKRYFLLAEGEFVAENEASPDLADPSQQELNLLNFSPKV
ncbi:hypothetical protein VNO77_30647 [Canavalia gladiata]|uniref:Uncharacterized protein n=1 Tax=Canavalia gladiata TaxID=3824 RepID=A0AAN9KQE5_CANGL